MAGWNESDRRDRLPANWETIRLEQLHHDGWQCVWVLSQSGRRCPRRATDVDHKHEKSDRNRIGIDLQSLCAAHHAKKTAIAARRFKYAKAQKRVRPGEEHPGLLS